MRLKLLFAIMLLGGLLSAVEPKPETMPVIQKGKSVTLTTYPSGNTSFRSGKFAFGICLGVHWSYDQTQKTASRTIYRLGDGVRVTGEILNVKYVEDVILRGNTAEISYSVNLTGDNPFGNTRHWEICPYIPQKTVEQYQNCRYAMTTASGDRTTGHLNDPLPHLKNLTSFTFFDIDGFDITLDFDGPAELLDRRDEKIPYGIWFFQFVRNNSGVPPANNAECGALKLKINTVPTGTAPKPIGQKTDGPATTEGGINHLWNPGFEQESNPGYADGWGPFYYNWPGRGESSVLMDWSYFIAVDQEKAFEGKNSLRMILPQEMNQLNCQHPYVRTMPTNAEAVWSIYAQSDEDNGGTFTMKIRPLKDGKWVEKTFTVGPEWTRCELPFRTPKTGGIQPWLTLRKGMVRFDATQLETGSRATAFHAPRKMDEKSVHATEKRDIQEFHIPLLSKAPELDRLLDDPVWKEAAKFDNFYEIQAKETVRNNKTVAFAGIHGSMLYIAADCQGKNRPPLLHDRDTQVWTDDAFEIFLDPGAPELMTADDALHSYYHIAVNSAGTIYDTYCGAIPKPFDGKIEVRTARTDLGWKAALAIDLAALPYTPVTEKWKFNLGREDVTNNQYSSIVPNLRNFHEYRSFPITVIPKETEEKLNRFSIRKAEANDGRIILYLNSSKAGRAHVSCSAGDREIDLKIGANHVTFNAENLPQKWKSTIEITALDGAKAVRDFEIATSGEHYFRHNYYTDEPEAEIIWEGQSPPTSGTMAKLDNQPVELKNRNGRIFIDITGIPNGKHTFAYKNLALPFEKIPSKKGEVKIDRRNAMLLVENKPFLLYGPWTVPFRRTSHYLTMDYTLPNLKKIGANAVSITIPEGYNDDEKAKREIWDLAVYRKMLDRCHTLGLKVFMDCSDYRNIKEAYRRILPLEKVVHEFRDHPAVLMWYIADEPITEEVPEVWRRYHLIKEMDPYHPVMINLTPHGLASRVITDRETGRNACDVISLTYYPVGNNLLSNPEQPLGPTSAMFRDMFQLIRSNHGVMIHAAQAYGYGTDHWYRTPTPAELEFLVYMPLIYGNSGWGWFGGRAPCRQTDDKIWALGAELKSIAPALEDLSSGEVLTSGNVIATLRKTPEAWFLIAVNTSEKPEIGVFQFAGELPRNCNNAEVLFENRQLKLNDFTLRDAFPGYGRHVYRICK